MVFSFRSSSIVPAGEQKHGEVVGRGNKWKRHAPDKEINVLAVHAVIELKVTVRVKVSTFILHS